MNKSSLQEVSDSHSTEQLTKIRSKEFECMKAAKEILIEEFTKVGHLSLRWWKGKFWKWNDRHYVNLSDIELKADVLRWLDSYVENPKPHQADQIVECLKSLTKMKFSVTPGTWISTGKHSDIIALKNGLLDIDKAASGDSDALMQNTPDFFALSSADYSYDPSAQCPKFTAALKLYFAEDQDRKALLLEWYGYCLVPDTQYNKIMVMTGDGANGKSVMLEVLRILVGKDSCSAVPLELIAHRFQAMSTYGKLVNISPEISKFDQKTEALLKSHSSGDIVQFEEKNKPSFSAKPTARLTLAANTMPGISDKTEAMYRRLLFLPFEFQIPEEQQDPRYKESGRADWPFRDEMPGILNLSLNALKQLRARGKFHTPELSKQHSEEYRNFNNPVRLFLKDRVEECETGSVPKEILYEDYIKWAGMTGHPVLSDSLFGRELRRMFPSVRKVKIGSGKDRRTVYKNIEFKQGEENE
ncbi:hypothetical protein JYT16_02245 [Gemmatimonas aurantiaca]|nr:hypothetical protein [Gemmatimonas aurantiaca]